MKYGLQETLRHAKDVEVDVRLRLRVTYGSGLMMALEECLSGLVVEDEDGVKARIVSATAEG